MDGGREAGLFSLLKSGHRFVVRCGTGREEEAISQLMQWAEDPDLDFDWFDAAVLSSQINQRLLGRTADTEAEGDERS